MLRFTVILSCVCALFTSCAEQCNIAGNSSVGSLDGQMLYLRVSNDGVTPVSIDSCEVIHGRFNFYFDMDSVRVAQLCMRGENVMPVVLEGGNLRVQVDHSGQRVSGGPFNDRLYRFIQRKNRLENEQWELDLKCLRMMREGRSSEDINNTIGPKARRLAKKVENLETDFIMDNYDNPLGTGAFMLLFSQYPLPIMTDQIRRIVNRAPESFMRDPFVNSYVRRARLNAKIAAGRNGEGIIDGEKE